jgi:PAS domain S-box-containing protein
VQVLTVRARVLLLEDAPLSGPGGEPLARGANLLAGLWDGTRVFGFLAADNLPTQSPILQEESEILSLFAATLGHLATRLRAEEALRVTTATLEQRAEEQTRTLRADRDRFQIVVEAAPDAIIVIEGDGRISLVNAQTERMFGFRREELIGSLVEVLMPERFRESHRSHRARYLLAPTTRPMGAGLRLFARRKDGSEFPVEISLSPLKTDSGCLVVSAIRDVTERRRLEEERDRLLQSEREKSEQLQVAIQEAHHRIKNNLQAVSNLLYLIVRLTSEDDGHLLSVQDDGPGLPPDFALPTHANLGLLVVQTLVDRDLDGRLTLAGRSGLRAEVWFP